MKRSAYLLLSIFLLTDFIAGAQEPQIVFQEFLSNKVEYGLTVSPDRQTVYFVKTDSFYVTKHRSIYKSLQVNGKWSTPKKVNFSGAFSDSSPFVSPDGKRLFFSSKRPVNGEPVNSGNIWYVDIINGEEGPPIFLKEVNSEASDYSPTVDKEGNLYFGSYRDGGQGSGDLWWSAFKNGKYQEPQNLGSNINSEYGEWGSCIAPNGQLIIFENSGKPQNQSASGDLYVAFKENNTWSKPIHLNNQLNSIGSDLTPKIHGDNFYFASNRENDYESSWNLNNVDFYALPLTEVLGSVQIETAIAFQKKSFFANEANTSAGVSWLDYNNDSYPDIFISNAQKQNNVLYLNQRGENFKKQKIEHITNDSSSTSVAAWADFDNDGDQDVLLGNQHGEDNHLFTNQEGRFTLHQTFAQGDTYHINWVDFDNDGDLDCLIPNAQTGITQLFQQKEHQFIPLSNALSELKGFHSGASWLDINNDNFQDLYLPVAGGNDEFFKYNPKLEDLVNDNTVLGTTILNQKFTSGISFGDYDNDGDLDAFLTNLNNQKNSLLENKNGLFHEIQLGLTMDELSSWAGSWGDYDNDGDLDIIVTNYDHPNSIFENKGGYFFKITIPSITDSPLLSSGMAWGDYNKDGFLDLVLANWEQKENTFLAGVPNRNNWLVCKLRGENSNNDAIGTKITIIYGEGLENTQYREIQSNMGLRSSPQKIAHFGLGQYDGPVTISVSWPSGELSTYIISQLNQYYEITEGKDTIISAH